MPRLPCRRRDPLPGACRSLQYLQQLGRPSSSMRTLRKPASIRLQYSSEPRLVRRLLLAYPHFGVQSSHRSLRLE